MANPIKAHPNSKVFVMCEDKRNLKREDKEGSKGTIISAIENVSCENKGKATEIFRQDLELISRKSSQVKTT